MDKKLQEEQLQKMVKRIKGSCLLALPQSAARILELSKDPNNGPREFAAVISSDLGLTAQILRFVNSSYFGFRSKITTIQMALSLVYGRTIRNFILWNAVFALLPNPRCGPFELKKICQDSLRRGLFAKIFSSYFVEQDPEELFLCALFQDMAVPILAQTWPQEYEDLLTQRQQQKRRLSDLEREKFGWDHAIAGSYLVDEWGFSDGFCEAIAEHTSSYEKKDVKNVSGEVMQKAIVAMSALLPSVVDEEWKEADEFFNLYFKFIRRGMPYPNVIFEQIESQIPELAMISQLGPVTNSLCEFHKKWLATFE